MNRCIPFLALALAVPVLAQEDWSEKFPVDNSPLASREDIPYTTSYAEVLEPARSAVVSVTSSRIVEIMQTQGSNPMEEFLRRFYGLPMPQTPPQQPGNGGGPQERLVPNGLGSGVIISSDGYILTNNHVVVDEDGEPADEIRIILNDRDEVAAEIVGRDPRTDVALLKIDRTGLPFLPMADSDQLRVGDLVFAIGNPLGIGQTSTMGIVSAVGRANLGILGNEGYEYFIQTDASINRGNSGGALIDALGRLVGINSAIYSQTGGNIGIGFAIPINLARSIVLELLETGSVQRGYLGVSIRDLDRNLAEAFNLAEPKGALVESVQEGTPAADAGIEVGDVIISVDGKPVSTVAELRLRIAGLRPGTEVALVVIRNGSEQEVTVALGSLDDIAGVTGTVTGDQSPLEGVTLERVTDETAEQLRLRETRGLLITDVGARSPYAGRLQRGMVILEVNDRRVNNFADLKEALVPGRINKLWIAFDGRQLFLALPVRE